MDATTTAIIGTMITGGVSIVAILANIYITKLNLRQGAVKEIGKISLELKIRQLNELYGPLVQLIAQNEKLAAKLREGKANPSAWRLMDHLPDILADPVDGPIARAILGIDSRIEELIINKGGLVRAYQPETFTLFLAHYQLLKLAMDGNSIKPTSSEYYPRELDKDVKTAYQNILSEVNAMLERFETALKETT